MIVVAGIIPAFDIDLIADDYLGIRQVRGKMRDNVRDRRHNLRGRESCRRNDVIGAGQEQHNVGISGLRREGINILAEIGSTRCTRRRTGRCAMLG